MRSLTTCRNTLSLILFMYCLLSTSCACESDLNCYNDDYRLDSHREKCCHGTCIDEDATCISGGAIAGIVIACLIIGGIIISCCLCFCCACGPFQNRSQGAVIRYGGQTATTTTGTSYPATNVQAGYRTSYPQPTAGHFPDTVQSQAKYPQSGPAPYPSAIQGQAPYAGPHGGTVYPPPTTAPPSYEEANVPPPYNPGYPQ